MRDQVKHNKNQDALKCNGPLATLPIDLKKVFRPDILLCQLPTLWRGGHLSVLPPTPWMPITLSEADAVKFRTSKWGKQVFLELTTVSLVSPTVFIKHFRYKHIALAWSLSELSELLTVSFPELTIVINFYGNIGKLL